MFYEFFILILIRFKCLKKNYFHESKIIYLVRNDVLLKLEWLERNVFQGKVHWAKELWNSIILEIPHWKRNYVILYKAKEFCYLLYLPHPGVEQQFLADKSKWEKLYWAFNDSCVSSISDVIFTDNNFLRVA